MDHENYDKSYYARLPVDYRGKYAVVQRNYGPYVGENKPVLQKGSTVEILEYGISYTRSKEGEPSLLTVYHAKHEYTVEWNDLVLKPES